MLHNMIKYKLNYKAASLVINKFIDVCTVYMIRSELKLPDGDENGSQQL